MDDVLKQAAVDQALFWFFLAPLGSLLWLVVAVVVVVLIRFALTGGDPAQ